MSRMINNKVNINIDVFVFWTTLHTISRQSQYLSTCASLDELGVIRGGQIFPLWKQSVNTRIFHDSHDIGLLFKPGRRLPLQALLSEKLNLVILLFLFSPLLCWALCCTLTHARWTPLPLLLLLLNMLNIMFVVLTLVGNLVGDQPTLFGHLVGNWLTLIGHLPTPFQIDLVPHKDSGSAGRAALSEKYKYINKGWCAVLPEKVLE